MSLSVVSNELIVLAAPTTKYYEKVENDIIDFQTRYAEKIIDNGDKVIILSDQKNYSKYAKAIDVSNILLCPMKDIWMRDFTLVNPINPLIFRYTAAGQGGGKKGQYLADEVQNDFYGLVKDANLSFVETNLLNDGGNWVDDYSGNIVISRKFLNDNNLLEKDAKEVLKSLVSVNNIAFIEADEQGGLEHADGVVSFIDYNTLVINSYPYDKTYSKKLKEDLKRGLPKVAIHEIITSYDDSDIYDESFGSACGIYTNMLVTESSIYFPQFDIPEDKIALKQIKSMTSKIKSMTSKKIIPVMSSQICKMGGGVRCMSLQIRGDNKEKLVEFLKNKQKK
ncbi:MULTISPECIES: agmatine deiminase family protein [Cysteiniphilum]|uniref:Agmatine deiminase n=1 Tax=Cysteiniphilum litorale TaxID=2056700 RepID=A0A8J3E963_9GAMM|nr:MULTISPECIES: agmatine deiminase family protein [Cysteiniphilum]GGG04903.1 hypothetical protein GCM10010995_22900 [Cysteiniphilum litorale]